MKKTLRAVLIVLAVLLVLCIAVGIWQRQNIAAVIDAFKYSEEDITTLMTDNEKIIDEALNEYPDIEVRDIEEHELKAFEQGEITEEDLVQIALGQTSLEEAKEDKKAPTSNKSDNKKPASKPTESKPNNDGDAKVAAILAKMYVLKSTYMAKLEGMIASAKADYVKLPKSQRSLATKQKLLTANVGRLAALESECDAAVNGILEELKTELKAQGKSLALIDSVKKAYENEKQLKKTSYINQFLD